MESWATEKQLDWYSSPREGSHFFSYSVVTGIYSLLSVAGPTLETFVGANINTILITNLLSGMDYNVKIFASQASGFSDALTGVVKTRKAYVLVPQTTPPSPHVVWPLFSL